MKKLIFIVIISFCGIKCFSQIYVPFYPTIYGQNFNRIKPFLVLHLPEKDSLYTNTFDTTAQMFYNKSDSSFWGWSISKGFFKISAIADTTIHATSSNTGFLSNIDWNRFNNKQDAIPNLGDTVKYIQAQDTLPMLAPYLKSIGPFPNQAVPFGNGTGVLGYDASGIYYDGTNLNVGHANPSVTSGITLNGGRASVGADINGMHVNIGSGIVPGVYDATKIYDFSNRGNNYLRMYTVGTGPYQHYSDFYTNLRSYNLKTTLTAPTTVGATKMVVVDSTGLMSWQNIPTGSTQIVDTTNFSGILKGSGHHIVSAVAGTDYLAPTGNGSGLTGITEGQVTNLTTDLASKANDASVMHLSGNETAAGNKQFNGQISLGKTYSNYGGYGNAIDLFGGIAIKRTSESASVNTYLLPVFDSLNTLRAAIALYGTNEMVFRNTTNNAPISFYTDATITLALKMQNGMVGIKKTPTVPLDVFGDVNLGGNDITLGDGISTTFMRFIGNSDNWFYNSGTGNMGLGTNNRHTDLFIQSNGNIGLGATKTASTYKIDVAGTGNFDGKVTYTSNPTMNAGDSLVHVDKKYADSLAALKVSTTGSYPNPAWITSLDYSKLTGTVPTWNQNTTGTASNLSGTPALNNGITATTQAVNDSSTKLATTAQIKRDSIYVNHFYKGQKIDTSNLPATKTIYPEEVGITGDSLRLHQSWLDSLAYITSGSNVVKAGSDTLSTMAYVRSIGGSSGSGSAWPLTGNTDTYPTTKFLGYTVADSLLFKIKNTNAGMVSTLNTSIGYLSLNSDITGTGNVAVGARALRDNTSAENTAVGNQAGMSITTGSGNTAMGYFTLDANLTGNSNTAVGESSLTNATAGNNTAVGEGSLSQLTTGTGNTGLGVDVGYNTTTPNQTLTNSTLIGKDAVSTVDGVSNSTAIGYQAQVTKSNQVVVGNSSVTQTVLHGKVIIQRPAGDSITLTSDVTRNIYKLFGSNIKAEPLRGNITNIAGDDGINDGELILVAVNLPTDSTITGVTYLQGISGVYSADGYNGFALYSYSAGTMTRIDTTANNSGAWSNTVNTWQTATFSTTHHLTAGVYFIGLLYNSSTETTKPNIKGYSAGISAAMGLDFTNGVKLNSKLFSQGLCPTTITASSTTATGTQLYLALY